MRNIFIVFVSLFALAPVSSFAKGKKINKIVVDAGHGGKDFGAVSLDGNVSEKDLNLAIVKKIKLLNTNPNINLIASNKTHREQREDEAVGSRGDFEVVEEDYGRAGHVRK